MKKTFLSYLVLVILLTSKTAAAQQVYLPAKMLADSSTLSRGMPSLANSLINVYRENDRKRYLANLSRLQIVGKDYSGAVASITALRQLYLADGTPNAMYTSLQFELYALAKMEESKTGGRFPDIFKKVIGDALNRMDDKSVLYNETAFLSLNGVPDLYTALNNLVGSIKKTDSISVNDGLALTRAHLMAEVFKNIEPVAINVMAERDKEKYIIEDSVLVKTPDGAKIAVMTVRKRDAVTPLAAAFFFTIYPTERILSEAKTAAAYGYVGVLGFTRGKGISPDPIEPYTHEPHDVNTVIDWIIRQPWSNGKVGMYGGSYGGYAQWAATKYLHPALKTIVPYVAFMPGQGLPMENNISLNANYQWPFYVMNNKYLDNKVNNDWERFENMRTRWFASGASYRRIDSIDGTPNKLLQEQLKHPSYDTYWQKKVPYRQEFSKINIPVLSITGYYDDGQISALKYVQDHYRYNQNANHYLIIGPYDHFGAQRGGVPVLRDYRVDPVALINTQAITFEWFDYIMKQGKKPAILKDRINFEIMGANAWGHAPSLEKMSDTVITMYLSDSKDNMAGYRLTEKLPAKRGSLERIFDLADRSKMNNDYYPFPIIRDSVAADDGFLFTSLPFEKVTTITGVFTGELKASINKKDMDIGINMYELTPEGKYFQLTYYLGRASYAKDMTTRKLLVPGKKETIPFERIRMVSRRMSKGSRLIVVVTINKNPYAQVNFGTGKDVSDETISDGKIPLILRLFNDSFIRVPVSYR